MIKDNVKIWCRHAGTSQAELARQIGVSRQRFSRMMNDPYLMTFGVMEDAAKQLGCSLADLMGFDGAAQEKLRRIRNIVGEDEVMDPELERLAKMPSSQWEKEKNKWRPKT